MQGNSHKLYSVLVVLIVFGKSLAQDKIRLKEYLPVLEKQLSVSFSYLENNVQSYIIPENFSKNTLAESLLILEEKTNLRFELISENKVIIRSFKDKDVVDVCGYVFDKDNIPISDVAIQGVLNIKTVFTNTTGYFQLNKIPRQSILVIRINQTYSKKISVFDLIRNSNCKRIQISLPKIVLNEVVIQNYLSEGFKKQNQKITLTPSKFKVIAGLTAPDIFQSIQQVPGVQSPFELASNVFVRGSRPDQNLILWNGIKTYNQSHFFGLLSVFNPSLVDKVDFYKKGTPSEYGDRVGGVIAVNSPNKIADKLSFGLGANLVHADIFGKIPIIEKRLSLSFSARRSFSDLWESITYDRLAERVFQNTSITDSEISNKKNTFFFIDYNFGVQAKFFKKDKLLFNVLFSQNDLDFETTNEVQSNRDKLITENVGYSLSYTFNYSDKAFQAVKGYTSNYLLDYSFLINSETLSFAEETKRNFVADKGVSTFFKQKFNKGISFKLGYEYSRNLIRFQFLEREPGISVERDADKNTLDTNSFFTELEFLEPENYLIQLGGRFNHYSVSNEWILEPRIYFKKYITPQLSLNSSITKQSQFVSQIQESVVSNLSLENLIWQVNREEIGAQNGTQVSVGGAYKNKGWLIEGDVYSKWTNNITTSLNLGVFNSTSENTFSVGDQNTMGAELFVKKKIRNYASWVSYSYSNQENRFEEINNNTFFTSSTNISHTFKWLHFYNWNQFRFSLSWLWHTGKAITNVTSEKNGTQPVEVFFDTINSGNLPEYHKLDFSALYAFKKQDEQQKWEYQLGVSVQNIYNRNSVINREFRTTPGINSELLVLDYNTLGFTPNVSFRVLWN